MPRGEWSLVPAKKFRESASEKAARATYARGAASPGTIVEAEAEDQVIMIQNLTDTTFGKVCVDSGAGESVCPVNAFPSYKTVKTATTGTTYKAAGGQKLTNIGEIRPCFKSSGVGGSMAFQATTDVQKPLAAASKIAAKGTGLFSTMLIRKVTSRMRRPGSVYRS